MGDTEMPKPKDFWDKIDVGGKVLISAVALLVTCSVNRSAAKRQANEKMLDFAMRILEKPDTSTSDSLHAWALRTFDAAANVSYVDLSDSARTELREGAWVLPNPKQLRVRIMFKPGTSSTPAFQVRDNLEAAGYANTEVRSDTQAFPNLTEVRYYYPDDSANARTLNSYLQHLLPTGSRLNPSLDRAPGHVPGELHVYVKQ
jgi:hypothetical protein